MMNLSIILVCLISLYLLEVFGADDDRPVIETPSGKYRGHILKTRDGRDILAFQGIPYAQPPVGDLRFKDPVKANKLDAIFDANEETKNCFQPSMNFKELMNVSSFIGSEDCLYLNVYVPQVRDRTGNLPVLVWIHGGGYMMGSGSTFWQGPEFLLDRNMIMVTFNYRLGILGFLSTGDSVLPGNMGMKDQVLALEWVKENIASFGGDANSVTIGGVSAGGAAVALQMQSPLSKGLFQRVIAQSGNAYSSFGVNSMENARESAKEIATYLGCSFEPQYLLKCLRKMPLHELFEASVNMMSKTLYFLNFYPVIEEENVGAFLTKESFNKPSEVSLLAGVTSNECKYFVQEHAGIDPKYEGDPDKLLQNLDGVLPTIGLYQNHPMKKEITKKLIEFYIDEKTKPTVVEFSKLCSDVMHNHGLMLTARKQKGPTYIYKFSYKSTDVFETSPQGLEDDVSHAEECMYLFNTKYFPRTNGWADKDVEFSNKISDMWYNFIRSGDPTPDSKLWEESQGGIKYLDFTNEGFHMKSNMFGSRLQFLDQLDIDITIPKRISKHDEL